jgi:putative MATE family efflux protein
MRKAKTLTYSGNYDKVARENRHTTADNLKLRPAGKLEVGSLRGLSSFKRKLVGDRAFYATVLALGLPIIIQSSISNFVNLLDNIMVGTLGTAEMSGAAIANQLIFVFNLCLFGGLSGPGIFGAQYYGAGDLEGLRNTFRIKLWISGAILALALTVFLGWGDKLTALYLTGEGGAAEAAAMMGYCLSYLRIMLTGLLPFALTMSYTGTLRETGETIIPMKAGIAAVLTNLGGNWLLIYGNLGFPRLGVEGAALATVLSRFVELGIILAAVRRDKRFIFLHRIYASLRVPVKLLGRVLKKGLPLLINEALWSLGVATLLAVYSARGLAVLAGMNIASTVNNLFFVVLLAMGNVVAVMTGQSLGANDMEQAKGNVWKLIAFACAGCVVMGGILAALSPVFPRIYNTDGYAQALASRFILTAACLMPINVISHCCYFTLRAGGSTALTFVFDSAFSWTIHIPTALLLVHLTGLDIMLLYPLCQAVEVLKCALGLTLVRKGVWIRNIVAM